MRALIMFIVAVLLTPLIIATPLFLYTMAGYAVIGYPVPASIVCVALSVIFSALVLYNGAITHEKNKQQA